MTAPLQIVALLFPNVTQLDLTGPAQVFARLPEAEVHFAWRDREPVPTDSGFSIVPTTTLTEAPQADLLFVPGGSGAFDLLEDDVALDFIADQAAGARFVTSVCTGSFALGAAGLLAGKRATSHWASLHMLEAFGAVPVSERVVRDDPVITGAGVSSGIDFALTVVAELYGERMARDVQLFIEYDPAPPFDAGSPLRPEADQQEVKDRLASVTEHRSPMVAAAAERLADRR
ncbi:DJ-1/PfpI family protein [Nesterenkonia natronophila]|uniref:DJ-1/PfpI family protein n=1 Tax=Nesterenkonia natronophila TaxID=2174932 RepID=A0A3A4F5C6_9MICC|nr:DJ-1/PfpI family protein [Nesterenkonia natronophila]RJN31670.1 DJ-1/PfpI family protein [Nesterenkonia natronophila]